MFGILVALVMAISTAGFFGYQHYEGVLEDLDKAKANLAQSEQNVATLEKAVQDQQATLQKTLQEVKQIQAANIELQNTKKQLQIEYSELDRKFTEKANGDTRSLANIALKKSSAIERVINIATQNAMRCAEIAMGSPLTENELNATKKSQTNPECPSLANPNYIRY